MTTPAEMPQHRGHAPAWRLTRINDDVHIRPLRDDVVHETTADCICGPAWSLTNEGTAVNRYVHWALDGRRGYGEGTK